MGELFSDAAQRKGLELVGALPPTLHSAYRGDAGRLRQILTNLVGNAIKFTETGELVVRVETEEGGDDLVRLRFEVVDTGIGIAKEAQSRIFESFSQADGSTDRRFGGTGLGLTISAQLTQLMGGEIGVQSTPARGSTFWFTVACLKESAPTGDINPKWFSGGRSGFGRG